MNRLIPTLVTVLLVFCLVSCQDAEEKKDTAKTKKKPQSWLRSIIGNFSSQDTIFLDSGYVDQFLTQYPAFNKFKKDIRGFYLDRANAYAWYEESGIIEQSGNLYNRIQNLEYDGIEDSLPYQERFEQLMDRPNRKNHRAELELMLTSQYFALANYVWKGLSEAEIKRLGWYIPRKKVSYASYLDSMLAQPEDDFLETEPLNPQYNSLRDHLKKYKEISSKYDWQPLVLPKKKLKEGDTASIIPRVKGRLKILGDFSGDTSSNTYDSDLSMAINSFQERHGLKADGQLTKSFIDELNVPIQARMETIIVNMERTRWLPVDDTTYPSMLLVNIPEYKLHVLENGKPAWDCNVVVGEVENKTVIFKGTLKYVVFSPHWNVPESIVKEEILPEIEKDPTYLEKQELEITGEKNGVPVIRQKPGTENSLGLVKFMFPNTHNIYLHDSPAKELFDRTNRAYSHGCIRVGEPVRLAEYLLEADSKWNSSTINEAMNSGEEKWVTLKNKVPVYIVYFTAWVDPNGKLNFRKDIYKNDSRLAGMILDTAAERKLASR